MRKRKLKSLSELTHLLRSCCLLGECHLLPYPVLADKQNVMEALNVDKTEDKRQPNGNKFSTQFTTYESLIKEYGSWDMCVRLYL